MHHRSQRRWHLRSERSLLRHGEGIWVVPASLTNIGWAFIFQGYKEMCNKNIIKTRRYESPCGILLLGSFGGRLCLCDWQTEKHRGHVDGRIKRMLQAEFENGTSEVLERAMAQLDEFFAGKRKVFDIPLLFVGSDFQKTVWNELLNIPYGQTISYGEMARRIGMPKAVRAVANANGANAISILAPCHRVIGSDGTLTGYGGGLAAKKMLLELEASINP